ncbi:MAG: hypothetical protein ACXVJE_19435 [Mucilaginibacter sp.]
MRADAINFSYNWNNKLFCRSFTTIRLTNPNKYKVGGIYDIQLNNKSMGPGTIIEIMNFKLNNLNEFMARLDTGYNVPECKSVMLNMYKHLNLDYTTQLFSFILIEKNGRKGLPIPDEFFVEPNQIAAS